MSLIKHWFMAEIFQVIMLTLRLNAKFSTSAVTTAKVEWPSTRSSVPTAPSSTKARTYELKEWYRDFVYFLNIAYRCNRNTCYYSENQKFCFLKSRLLTCPKCYLGTIFFVCCPNELKFSASYYFGISWMLKKCQLIRTIFIVDTPSY